jgi:hypothetical protein
MPVDASDVTMKQMATDVISQTHFTSAGAFIFASLH